MPALPRLANVAQARTGKNADRRTYPAAVGVILISLKAVAAAAKYEFAKLQEVLMPMPTRASPTSAGAWTITLLLAATMIAMVSVVVSHYAS